MKNKLKAGLVVVLVMGLLVGGSWELVAQAQGWARGAKNGIHEPEEVVGNYEQYELTDKQIEDLKFMYQEEKLARDLYTKLREAWELRTFGNIAQSEQQHMEALAALFEKYDLEMPNSQTGEFENDQLAVEYNKLVEQGLESEKTALEIGKALEEKDIKDLEAVLEGATPDLKAVYQNLKSGSENHLQAFERQLSGDVGYGQRQGQDNRGKGNGQRQGRGNGRGQGQGRNRETGQRGNSAQW